MIERKLIFVACIAGTLIASCTPFPENKRPVPPQGPNGTVPGTVSDLEQQKLKEERAKAKKEADRQAAAKAEKERMASDTGTTQPDAGGTPAPEKPDYEYATPVPGKTGFVLSPYNGKIIDVRDIPSGTLVQDPTYPASEKKYFRVP